MTLPDASPEQVARDPQRAQAETQELFNKLEGRLTPDEIKLILASRAEAKPKLTPLPPIPETEKAMVRWTESCTHLLDLLFLLVPKCNERDMAYEKLEEMRMWANLGIVRHQK